MSAFEGMLNGNGQQFDIALDLGGRRFMPAGFSCASISTTSQTTSSAPSEARLALSADENIDGQDLYIQLKEGEVSAYYSSDFALTADIGTFGDIIDKFSAWADSLNGQSQRSLRWPGTARKTYLNNCLRALRWKRLSREQK